MPGAGVMVPPLLKRGRLVHVARRIHRNHVHQRQCRRISEMVEVPMADQQHIDLAQCLQIFVDRGGQWIELQPRVDDDDLAAGRGDAKSRLSEPEDFGLAALCRSHIRRQRQAQGHQSGQAGE